MSDQDQPVVIPADFWDEIERHARHAQGLAEAFTLLTQCDRFHDLGAFAEVLEHHTGRLFSLLTDPGELKVWRREWERRSRPALALVE